MPAATVNGITIAFDDRCPGGDTLTFVHGHPFNRSMWSPQLTAATDAGWRADHRGKRRRNALADRLLREGMERYAAEMPPRMLATRRIDALPAVAHHVLTMMRTTKPDGAAAALRGRAERPAPFARGTEMCREPSGTIVSETARVNKMLAGFRLIKPYREEGRASPNGRAYASLTSELR